MIRVIACILLTTTCVLAQPQQQKPNRPNIVLIMADDMGFSDIGCYGSEIETPNLDRLAQGGLRFTQFYNTARCCPTRASLLTGLYPHQAGVGHMTGTNLDHPGYRGDMSRQTPTIAEVLKAAGYVTYMTGKWHVTANEMPNKPKYNWPINRGFDDFYGTIKGGGNYFDPAMLTRGDKPISPVSDKEYQPQQPYYYTDAIGDHASWFIRSNANKRKEDDSVDPFFVYVAFTAPHWPLHAPSQVIQKYGGKYDAGYEAVRAARFARMKEMKLIDQNSQLSPAPWKWRDQKNKQWEARCMEVYAAQVDRMDQNIGKIIDTLEQTDALHNTLILFLSDNGGCAETMGRETHADRRDAPTSQPRPRDALQLDVFPRYTIDGRPIKDGEIVLPGDDDTFIAYGEGWANVSNTPFREYKHWVHEGGIATPLIAHWPAKIGRHGELDPQPGHLIDIMPTLVEISGASFPAVMNGKPVQPMEGVSLLPAFAGKPLGRTAPIYFEHEGNRAIRDGQWKLVAKRDQPWELYDISVDRSELNDLASEQPDRVKELSEKWQRWAERAHVLPMNAWVKKNAASRPARRALLK